MDWLTADSVGAVWSDAPADPDLLAAVVAQAKADVLEFDAGASWHADGTATPFPGDYPAGAVPSWLVTAQLMHARSLALVARLHGQLVDVPLDWVVKRVATPRGGA